MKPHIVLGEYITKTGRQVMFNFMTHAPPQGFCACGAYINSFLECLNHVEWSDTNTRAS